MADMEEMPGAGKARRAMPGAAGGGV